MTHKLLPMKLWDLTDARRANKPWLPADDRDVTVNHLVVLDDHGKPACIRHGAMNRVHPFSLIYRCSEQYCGVGAELLRNRMSDWRRYRARESARVQETARLLDGVNPKFKGDNGAGLGSFDFARLAFAAGCASEGQRIRRDLIDGDPGRLEVALRKVLDDEEAADVALIVAELLDR